MIVLLAYNLTTGNSSSPNHNDVTMAAGFSRIAYGIFLPAVVGGIALIVFIIAIIVG
jgi:hypothetical protein